MILAGDIGAVNSHLAIFPQERNATKPIAKKKFSNKSYSNLEAVITDFKNQTKLDEPIYVACFGIAGPVINGRCEMPGTGWVVTIENLQDSLSCMAVDTLNDMPAIGYAIPSLSGEELIDINPKASPKEGYNRAVILGTGTGLGEMLLFWDRDDFRPSPSEGGHANFAPHNDLEIEFLRYCHTIKMFHVSVERVISWDGLKKLYEFLRDQKKVARESAEVKKRLMQPDGHLAIPEMADQDDLCKQTVESFLSIYGAEAGDLALRTLAVNGVYVGGAIALKMLDKLQEQDGPFMKAFADKEGQFAKQNSEIPVRVINNPESILVGAARRARIMAGLE